MTKSDERKQREEKVLKDFGYNLSTASKEIREHAQYVAEKSYEVQRGGRR